MGNVHFITGMELLVWVTLKEARPTLQQVFFRRERLGHAHLPFPSKSYPW